MPVDFKSALDHIGGFLKTIFEDATKAGEVAEPIVDIAFPEIAGLYNFTVQQAALAEAAAAGATGAGPQKLATVAASVAPYAEAALAKDGVPAPTAEQIAAYINAVVASLKALPAPVAAPAA